MTDPRPSATLGLLSPKDVEALNIQLVDLPEYPGGISLRFGWGLTIVCNDADTTKAFVNALHDALHARINKRRAAVISSITTEAQ